MLPIHRKSIEPLAAHTDPLHVAAKHQSLHHFVAKAGWSDSAVMARIRDWVLPHLGLDEGCYWIIDDTGYPKKGTHSVGVARQYCGQLGKQDNCQVAVSLSLASVRGSLPVGYQLYLPKDWAADLVRRKKAGVPDDVRFATKPEIALEQIRQALASGVPMGVVLADAGYGDETHFRDGITELGMLYALGIRPATTVWAPGTAPLPPKPWSGRGIRPTRLRREPGNEPVAVKTLAMELPQEAYSTLTWREGTNTDLSSRFAAVRVRPAHRDYLSTAMRPEEWLLIEWPEGETEPAKYFLCTAPSEATLEQLVFVTKMRWRIERDYQELKQEFGLTHYEPRLARLPSPCHPVYCGLRLSRHRAAASGQLKKKPRSTRSVFPTRRLHPSRQPGESNDTCLTRFRRCDYSSPTRSSAGLRAVRAAGMSG
jgi:SRSO17 transposase